MHYRIVPVADSFEILRAAPDNWADHIITDPPYDAHCHANQTSGTAFKRGDGKGGIPKIEPKFAALSEYEFCRDMVRVARRWALCFSTVEAMGRICDTVGPASWVRSAMRQVDQS